MNKRTRFYPAIALSLLVLALWSAPRPVLAHDRAQGVVKERMALMKTIGKAMKSISETARGKAPLDGAKVAAAARAIAHHGQRIPTLFPEGSGHGVTEARPKIWQDPAGFRQGAERLVEAAGALASAADTRDAEGVKAAYRAVGRSCGGCHRQFRRKKKH